MKEDNKVIRLIYTFFLGLLLAIFIGVGINSFYVSPAAPEFPNELNTYGKDMTEEQVALQNEYDQNMESYHKNQSGPYNRNVSIMTLSAAVVLLALSMFLEKKKIKVVADGIMLGGLFTLIYSIGRGFASQNTKYTFLTVTIGLVIVLYLGYHRFVREHNPEVKISKNKS